MGKCYFVSDLHLLANRSDAHRYLEEIVHAASHADTFVLGGDIFDFHWSSLSIQKSIERASNWLEQLTAFCPKCQFHMVLGNHDYHQAFIDHLEVLEQRITNLAWHRFYLRLGNSVFLHGDVANKEMDASMLIEFREGWLEKRRRGPFASALYDVVILTRLHKPIPHLVFSKRIVVRRIFKYLESIGQGPSNGVHDVYFGHTHKRVNAYRYRGLTFHNGGAPIKGVKFRILEAKH